MLPEIETETDFECVEEEVEENFEPRPIPQLKYDLLTWTEHEKLLQSRVGLRNRILATICVPFSAGLQVKLRRSVFGTFLKFFNRPQRQDEFINENKFTITETIIKEFNAEKRFYFDYNNNLLDDAVDYLNKSIKAVDEIDYDYLYAHLKNLRLDDYHINAIDEPLHNFENLQALALCGNWITDIDGSILPRRLKFLELYANELTSLQNLLNHPPKHLTHLGLGRNKLTNDSTQPLAGKTGIFNRLKSLDLSDCDIYHLPTVLEDLRELCTVEALSLRGNPCSMIACYKDMVLDIFPDLIFLDGIEIRHLDRRLVDNFRDNVHQAEFVFDCFKLTGIPKPPKEKKLKQTFHIEFTLPLFQEDFVEDIPDSELDEGEEKHKHKDKKSKHEKKGKSKSKASKSKKTKGKSKGSKSSKGSPYTKANEYNPRKKYLAFKTERRPWSNNISFPPVILQSPENNLYTYRDTFRSTVDVRVVYMITQDPPKKGKKGKGKKGKGKKKDKKEKKSDKKSKKSKHKHEKDSHVEEEKKKIVEKKPQEIVHKRITLVDTTCDLFSPPWHKDCEFYWAEDPLIGHKAMEMEKYLQMLEDIKEKERLKKMEAELAKKAKAAAKAKKGGKDKKSKSSKSSKSSKKSKKSKSSKKSKKSKKSNKSRKSKKGSDHIVWQFGFGMKRLKNNPN